MGNQLASPRVCFQPDSSSRRQGRTRCPDADLLQSFRAARWLGYSPNASSGFLGKLFGDNGKTSIRTGWGLFYNPMEQLVMEQFGAEPPFGGSTFLSGVFFNTPFVAQSGTVNPNPYNGILNPIPGQPQDLAAIPLH